MPGTLATPNIPPGARAENCPPKDPMFGNSNAFWQSRTIHLPGRISGCRKKLRPGLSEWRLSPLSPLASCAGWRWQTGQTRLRTLRGKLVQESRLANARNSVRVRLLNQFRDGSHRAALCLTPLSRRRCCGRIDRWLPRCLAGRALRSVHPGALERRSAAFRSGAPLWSPSVPRGKNPAKPLRRRIPFPLRSPDSKSSGPRNCSLPRASHFLACRTPDRRALF